jgi:hypothetical protein
MHGRAEYRKVGAWASASANIVARLAPPGLLRRPASASCEDREARLRGAKQALWCRRGRRLQASRPGGLDVLLSAESSTLTKSVPLATDA